MLTRPEHGAGLSGPTAARTHPLNCCFGLSTGSVRTRQPIRHIASMTTPPLRHRIALKISFLAAVRTDTIKSARLRRCAPTRSKRGHTRAHPSTSFCCSCVEGTDTAIELSGGYPPLSVSSYRPLDHRNGKLTLRAPQMQGAELSSRWENSTLFTGLTTCRRRCPESIRFVVSWNTRANVSRGSPGFPDPHSAPGAGNRSPA